METLHLSETLELIDKLRASVASKLANVSSGAEAPELRHSAEVVEVPAGAGELEAEAVRAMMRTPFRLARSAEERAVNRALDAYQILMQIASSQRHMITIGRGSRLKDWDITVYRDGRAQALRIPFNGSFLDAMHHVRAKMQSEHMDDGIDWALSGKDEY